VSCQSVIKTACLVLNLRGVTIAGLQPRIDYGQ
jgi:hypothetical protein